MDMADVGCLSLPWEQYEFVPTGNWWYIVAIVDIVTIQTNQATLKSNMA